VTVHDIEMQNRAAPVNGLLRVGAKLREVSGENRWREFNVHGTVLAPSPRLDYTTGDGTVARLRASLAYFS